MRARRRTRRAARAARRCLLGPVRMSTAVVRALRGRRTWTALAIRGPAVGVVAPGVASGRSATALRGDVAGQADARKVAASVARCSRHPVAAAAAIRSGARLTAARPPRTLFRTDEGPLRGRDAAASPAAYFDPVRVGTGPVLEPASAADTFGLVTSRARDRTSASGACVSRSAAPAALTLFVRDDRGSSSLHRHHHWTQSTERAYVYVVPTGTRGCASISSRLHPYCAYEASGLPGRDAATISTASRRGRGLRCTLRRGRIERSRRRGATGAKARRRALGGVCPPPAASKLRNAGRARAAQRRATAHWSVTHAACAAERTTGEWPTSARRIARLRAISNDRQHRPTMRRPRGGGRAAHARAAGASSRRREPDEVSRDAFACTASIRTRSRRAPIAAMLRKSRSDTRSHPTPHAP